MGFPDTRGNPDSKVKINPDTLRKEAPVTLVYARVGDADLNSACHNRGGRNGGAKGQRNVGIIRSQAKGRIVESSADLIAE